MGGGWPGRRGVRGMGGKGGGDLRVVITPTSSLSIPWGKNILDVQGGPPLAEGQCGFPLERREIVASLGKREGGKYMGGFVHYCLCAGHSSLLLLGMAQYLTTLEGLLSYLDTVSRSF